MDFFTFEPADYQVLEDIEFDETIERPERIRFFTLEEQAVDAFEKLIPRGRVTKYQLNEVKHEVERLEDLYKTYVIPTAEDYTLREPVFGKKLDWVYPVYASAELKPYSFAESILPLYDNTTQRGFYPRLLPALPKPFLPTTQGQPYPLTEPQEFLGQDGREPLRALPAYVRTRAQIHEDRTVSLLNLPMDGTADTLHFKGYYLAKRPLDIPNPLPDHDFFGANESTFLETTAPLTDVVPSVDAILTHGVPVTPDPYGVAKPYLKLYDVNLRDIPWAQWRSKFPQAEVVSQPPALEEIPFPKPDQQAPGEKIVTAYKSQYFPGVSPRKWLMNQPDGGEFVVRLLLSEAINNGSVESIPGVELAAAAYPETTLDECTLLGKSFQAFTTQGVLRKTKDRLECVPLEFIKQERARLGYKDRKPWKETTANQIRESYARALATAFPVLPVPAKSIPEPKTPARPDSLLHKEVQLILYDSRRFADDKVRDIQDLLRTTTTETKKVFSDADGNFVVCGHTLAVLNGDLKANKDAFYDTWTARVDGFRVCRFCGEHVVGDDLDAQHDYDEDGFILRQSEVIRDQTFHATEMATYLTGLRAIQPLFQMNNVVDATCFLVLSILQVLPSAEVVDPLLKVGRELAAKQYGKKDDAASNKARGAIGLAIAILILQIHVPVLIPRRSFGNKPLKLDGFPRDAEKAEGITIVDSIATVLRKTFEAFPTTFTGPESAVIRGLLTTPDKIKSNVVVLLTYIVSKNPDIRTGLDRAKAHVGTLPVAQQPTTLLPVVVPPKELNTVQGYPPCVGTRPFWTSGKAPRLVQPVVPLRSGIQASPRMIEVEPAVSARVVPQPIPKTEIATRLKRKTGLKTRVPIRDDYHVNLAVVQRLSTLFGLEVPVAKVDPAQNADELRDIALGFLYDTLQTIQADPVKRTKLEQLLTKDIALYTLLSDYKEQKASLNKLRATERIKFVERMAQKTDDDREVTQQLLQIGVAPYIITNKDRDIFAREAERLQQEFRMVDTEVGVGVPNDFEEQGDFGGFDAPDRGDYGDYAAAPRNDGRDHEQPYFGEDDETSI